MSGSIGSGHPRESGATPRGLQTQGRLGSFPREGVDQIGSKKVRVAGPNVARARRRHLPPAGASARFWS